MVTSTFAEDSDINKYKTASSLCCETILGLDICTEISHSSSGHVTSI